jgi:imidazolonepropionase-like amidohydrolase
MRNRLINLLLLGLLLLTTCPGCASDLALVGAKIYPSPSEPPIENGSILVQDGHILAVGASATIKIPRQATVIDCKGLVVTAGFWNSHVHIFTPRLLHVPASTAQDLDEQLGQMFNRWGFTTVFDLGSALDNTLALRR